MDGRDEDGGGTGGIAGIEPEEPGGGIAGRAVRVGPDRSTGGAGGCCGGCCCGRCWRGRYPLRWPGSERAECPVCAAGPSGSSWIARICPLSDTTRSMMAWGAVSVGSSARLRRRRGALAPELSPYWASSSATVRCWPPRSSDPRSRLIDSTVPRAR